MEDVVSIDPQFWRERSVLVTGHTGFKGSWLAVWLKRLGARVHGYALDPAAQPNLFEVARVRAVLDSDSRADLADSQRLRSALAATQPAVVFHLAAQSLVRESYREPLRTFSTNVLGSAELLEAVRQTPAVLAVIVVTTDKVYDNRESVQPYRETDPLGGHDPYSASKAAAELITSSYRKSFFAGAPGHHGARIATARAGNVIGGGDWSADRLVPDCLRAFTAATPVVLRYPDAVRPWQHVLEPLSGYLLLAQRLVAQGGERFATAWNFGPDARDDATVGDVAQRVAKIWGDGAAVVRGSSVGAPHEAGLLALDSSRARSEIGWWPRWSLDEALERTVAWHRAWARRTDMLDVSMQQIAHYESAVRT